MSSKCPKLHKRILGQCVIKSDNAIKPVCIANNMVYDRLTKKCVKPNSKDLKTDVRMNISSPSAGIVSKLLVENPVDFLSQFTKKYHVSKIGSGKNELRFVRMSHMGRIYDIIVGGVSTPLSIVINTHIPQHERVPTFEKMGYFLGTMDASGLPYCCMGGKVFRFDGKQKHFVDIDVETRKDVNAVIKSYAKDVYGSVAKQKPIKKEVPRPAANTGCGPAMEKLIKKAKADELHERNKKAKYGRLLNLFPSFDTYTLINDILTSGK